MKVKKLLMKDFRNYSHETIEFGDGVNMIIGENAQGKTNLLEALYLCAALRSFRTRKERDLVNFNSKFGYIKINLLSQPLDEREEAVELEMVFSQDQKKRVKRNGLSQTRISDVMGTFKAVLFSPEDLKIVKDSPAERRQFMDSEMMQVSPKYYHTLLQYQKNIKQRNQLLKKASFSKEEMLVWELQLAEYGAQLMTQRFHFLKEIETFAVNIHQQLTEGQEVLTLGYEPGITLPTGWFNEPKETLVENIMQQMERNRVSDQMRQTTGKGPHRDDLSFKINRMDVRQYGSQGQKRTVVLSLKLAVLEWMKEKAGEYPVLLLDDVTSELDEKRQRDLLDYLKPVQTIITTTHPLPGVMEKENKVNVIHVEKGKITS
mgnify:CR=1 FL=1